MAYLDSIPKKMDCQNQMTLESDLLEHDLERHFQVLSSSKELGTKWYRWMNLCYEHVRLCMESGYLPSLEDVQKYMLSEIGLRHFTTSHILRDLARVGKIQVIKNKVIPCK